MALKITTLNPSLDGTSVTNDGAVFKDIHLDYEFESTSKKQQLVANNTKNDLKVDKNYSAISNSLLNIFNTSPGEKILNPRFGADLKKFLFQPITEETASIIGDVILKAIELYEPRVIVKQVVVIPVPDDYEYQIAIYLEIPDIPNENFAFSGSLSESGVSTTAY